jgi:alkylation response protein AidB-like acyl-CoA dehydrogenase
MSIQTVTPALLARATALVPMLRSRAEDTEKARRVAPSTLDALSEAGVFRMMAPRRYGGDEADFRMQCDVLAEIARGCPSTSGVATIYSAMAWVASVFPDQAPGKKCSPAAIRGSAASSRQPARRPARAADSW